MAETPQKIEKIIWLLRSNKKTPFCTMLTYVATCNQFANGHKVQIVSSSCPTSFMVFPVSREIEVKLGNFYNGLLEELIKFVKLCIWIVTRI
jgi:type III secretory pathway component EscT